MPRRQRHFAVGWSFAPFHNATLVTYFWRNYMAIIGLAGKLARGYTKNAVQPTSVVRGERKVAAAAEPAAVSRLAHCRFSSSRPAF